VLFTVEFIVRIVRSHSEKYIYFDRKVFPFVHISPFAWIDLIAILPFWLGFILPANVLGYVRMMRVFRLLKFYRYSRTLQLNALAFYRAYNQLRGLVFQVFITSLFFTLMVFQAEHDVQPEAFSNLGKASWFTVVTSTTVGYGDRAPITAIGMIVVSISMPIIIAQMGAALGIFGSCFQQVMEEERNPNVDPIALFVEERKQQLAMSRWSKKYSKEQSE
jgi:voltage-gated potassium channel